MAVGAEELRMEAQAYKQSLGQALVQVDSQIHELTSMRIRNLLNDEEFVHRRKELQQERLRIQSKLSNLSEDGNLFEPFREVVSFSSKASDWFTKSDDRAKRQILQTACSNLLLKDKKIKFEAKKPFALLAKSASYPRRLGVGGDVRTSRVHFARVAKQIFQYSKTEEGERMMTGIRAILSGDHEMIAKLAPLRRYARVGRATGRARIIGASSLPPLLS